MMKLKKICNKCKDVSRISLINFITLDIGGDGAKANIGGC